MTTTENFKHFLDGVQLKNQQEFKEKTENKSVRIRVDSKTLEIHATTKQF